MQSIPKGLKAGFFKNISNYNYHSGDFKYLIQSTDLKKFKNSASPLHFKLAKDSEEPFTKAFNFGNAFHSWLLGYPEDVVLMPEINRRSNIGKEKYKRFLEENRDKYILKEAEFNCIHEMDKSIQKNKRISRLLKNSQKELTGFFQDPISGVWCKIRCDVINFDLRIIADFKSTLDASIPAFERELFSFERLYHWSGSFYSTGAQILTGDPFLFLLIAVEKKPPYGVNIFELKKNVIQFGWDAISPIIEDMAECYQKDQWPGFDESIKQVDLPVWAKKNGANNEQRH